jgi:Asp-tRNA(Asn)/Glu-tRNA(Gln) amidotransferase C subunit
MGEKRWLSRQTFLEMAKAASLDTEDSHMEELYIYLKKVLPGLKSIEELDLTNMEPSTPFICIRRASL